MGSLRVVSADPSDRGSQRCRLGPEVMSSLGVGLGSPLLVRVPGGSVLCSAWPRQDLAEGFLQVDLKCVSPDLVPGLPPHLTLDPGLLTAVPTNKLKAVRVRVVVQGAGLRRRGGPRVSPELVKDLLRGVYVHTGFVVNMEDFDSEIKYVVMEDLSPEGSRAGLVTSRTAVEVSGVQTVCHFRTQLRSQDTDQDLSPLGGLEEVESSLRDAAAASALPQHPEFPGGVLPPRTAPSGTSGGGKDPAGPPGGGGGGGQPGGGQRARGRGLSAG